MSEKHDVPQRPVALVTGASRGLGRRIALSLAAAGYAVAVNCRVSHGEAEDVAQEAGGGSIAAVADVGDMGQVEGLANLVRTVFGRLDAVVNNAGIVCDNLLLRQSEKEWDAVIRTNLKGCFNVTRVFAPLLAESGGGHILNISSYSGLKGKSGQAAYSASKAALLGFTKSAARELSAYRIRVNALLPGYLETAMGEAAAAAMDQARRESVLGMLASADEAAELAVCLLRTDRITGQVFSLDSRIL